MTSDSSHPQYPIKLEGTQLLADGLPTWRLQYSDKSRGGRCIPALPLGGSLKMVTLGWESTYISRDDESLLARPVELGRPVNLAMTWSPLRLSRSVLSYPPPTNKSRVEGLRGRPL